MKPNIKIDLNKFVIYKIAQTEIYCAINKSDNNRLNDLMRDYKNTENIPATETIFIKPLNLNKQLNELSLNEKVEFQKIEINKLVPQTYWQ